MNRFLMTNFFLVLGLSLLFLSFPLVFGQSNTVIVENFNVRYQIEGGQIIDIVLDEIFTELLINFTSNDDGFIEINIPRGLLNSVSDDGIDDIFFVLVDGFETEYIETESNSSSRTIVIPFFIGDGQIEIIGTDVLLELEEPETKIPDWIKNNAGWWSEGLIGDSEFVSGIQYLITKGIMVIPYTTSDQPQEEKIPDWIKNNAGWWSEGLIGDSEFVSGIQYLISKGIMSV